MNKELYEVLVDREEILRNYKNLQDKYYSLIKSVNLIKKEAKQELRQEVINQINMGLSLDLIKENLEKELKQEVNE